VHFSAFSISIYSKRFLLGMLSLVYMVNQWQLLKCLPDWSFAEQFTCIVETKFMSSFESEPCETVVKTEATMRDSNKR